MTRVSPLPHPDEQETVTGGGALSVANIIDRAVGITCRAVILLTGIALLVLLTAQRRLDGRQNRLVGERLFGRDFAAIVFRAVAAAVAGASPAFALGAAGW